MIIGITGYFAAGKGEAAEYLHTKHGLAKLAYGDMLRDELRQMGKALGRDAEYNHGNVQRQKYGSGYWSKKIIQSIKPGEQVVVEGIRNPGELKELAEAPDFHLIAVTAPLELRFKRMLKRHKEGDPRTLDELKAKEARETHSENPNEQNIAACVREAEFVINNDGDEQSLYKQLDEIVEKLEGRSNNG